MPSGAVDGGAGEGRRGLAAGVGLVVVLLLRCARRGYYTVLRGRPEFSYTINRYFKILKLAVHEASFRREIMRKAAVPEAVRSTALI